MGGGGGGSVPNFFPGAAQSPMPSIGDAWRGMAQGQVPGILSAPAANPAQQQIQSLLSGTASSPMPIAPQMPAAQAQPASRPVVNGGILSLLSSMNARRGY